jgi:hypothetical protein
MSIRPNNLSYSNSFGQRSRAPITYVSFGIFRLGIAAIVLVAAPTVNAKPAFRHRHAAQAAVWIRERIGTYLEFARGANNVGDDTWEVFFDRLEILFHEIVNSGVFGACGCLCGTRCLVYERCQIRVCHVDVRNEFLLKNISERVVELEAKGGFAIGYLPG